MANFTFFLLLFVLCYAVSFAGEDVKKCYDATSYWTGLKTGTKEECSSPTSYCYVVWGKTAHGGSSRGCAPDYISRLCDDLKPNKKDYTQNCFTVATEYVNGRVCCCRGNLCNSGSRNKLLTTSLVALILYYFPFGAFL